MIFVYKGEVILLMKEMNLIEPIQRALKTEGYTKATDIQIKAIPALLKGQDLLGCAQTGERVIIVIGCINALVSRVSETFIKNLHLIFL